MFEAIEQDAIEAAEERSAIAEHDGGLSRQAADEYSAEYLMQCLAKTLLRWSLEDRRQFLAKWQSRHGEKSAKRLKAALTAAHAAKGGKR